MKHRQLLTKYCGDAPFWKVTLRLAIPIALQNLLISSLALVDTLMVGQLGDVQLASVGMAGQWSWLMNLVLFGIASGTSMFISQYWGVGDIKSIHKTYGIALCSSVAVAMVFTIVGIVLDNEVLSVFNQDPRVIGYGTKYIQIAAFSYVALAISSTMSVLLRATENVKLPMYIAFCTTVMNAILNYGLIFGELGMPEMGVQGAALATSLSSWTGVVLLFLFSYKQKNILIAPIQNIFKFTKNEFTLFFRKALPVIFNEGSWGLGTVLFNIIFSNLGYEYYASITILKTFEGLVFVFFNGLCSACCVMVGKSIGRGKIERGMLDAKRFSFLIPFSALVLGVVVALSNHTLVSLFNLQGNLTETTLHASQGIIIIYGLHLMVRNIPYAQIVGIFRSGGDTTTGMKFDLFCLWLLSLPMTYVCAYVLKLPFVLTYAIMYIFEDYPKAILCIRHFISMKWIRPVTKDGQMALEAMKNLSKKEATNNK